MSFTVMNYKVCKHVSFCSNSEEKAIFWGAFCALAVSLVLNGGLLLLIVTRGRPLSPLHILTIRYTTYYIPIAGGAPTPYFAGARSSQDSPRHLKVNNRT